MTKTCWICYQACPNDLKCKCNNEFAYCHNSCLRKWILESNKKKCIFCDYQYKFPIYFLLWTSFWYYIRILYYAYLEICEYDLETGLRWDEEF